ncbi:Mus7/MMS22 family-domain-containing protein [Xylariaceae sp. FL0016]|nr:Mus7/MMS22 family-domain-containing protein [Xylariaceae sp. FL0016]
MAKWKELGEVPDSDDESASDTQESQQYALPSIDDNAQDAQDTQDDIAQDGLNTQHDIPEERPHDVWDIPSSSQTSTGLQDQLPASTVDLAYSQFHAQSEHEPSNHNTPRPSSSPSLTPPPHSRSQTPRVSEPPPQHAPRAAAVDEPVSAAAAINLSAPYIDAVFEIENDTDVDSNEVARQADTNMSDEALQAEFTRLGRSLRPRKPIQEHPYLLESAQYSKTLKSHGVRPVRMQIQEALRRKQEEDSQEQDYEEESQQTAKDTAPEETEESQEVRQADSFYDMDELALSSDGPSSSPPRQTNTLIGSSIRSSQDDDEEFPDLADLEKWKSMKKKGRPKKRLSSPKASTKKKVARVHGLSDIRDRSPSPETNDIFDIPPSPPQTSPALFATTPLATLGQSRFKNSVNLTPKPSSTVSSRIQSPAPANHHPQAIDLTALEDDEEEEDNNENDGINRNSEQHLVSSGESESETETAQAAVRRRIRGVLPASWLRLDQQKAQPKKPIRQPSREPSPERSHRKGVAQRRQVSPRPGGFDSTLFLDESDDESTTLRMNDIDDVTDSFHSTDSFPIFEDDAGSVIEESTIDPMLPSAKRSGTETASRPRKRRKGEQKMFRGQPTQRKHQQRLTSLGRTESLTSNIQKRDQSKTHTNTKKHRNVHKTTRSARPQAPRLGILDVAENNAPQFIRIAARTAKKRQDKGRSSPSRKCIVLGTRKDNIDVTEIIRAWESGGIQPKALPNPAPRRRLSDSPQPLQDLSTNSTVQPAKAHFKTRPKLVMPSNRFSEPRRMIKQSSIVSFVHVGADDPPSDGGQRREHIRRNQSKPHDASLRPAQLEATSAAVSRQTFDNQKRALDSLYRRSRRPLPTPANVRLERVFAERAPHVYEDRQETMATKTSPPGEDSIQNPLVHRKGRLRKQAQPRSVDTTAPQLAHANDPIPRQTSPLLQNFGAPEKSEKLIGLGPFGTHYTQHFEVFPLDSGVFFHHTTLLGSGRVALALKQRFNDITCPRESRTYTLGRKILQWGSWNAQTSSEFGILFDRIADDLQTESPISDLNGQTAIEAADFILDYLCNSIGFSGSEDQKLFANRALETLQGFERRFTAISSRTPQPLRPMLEVSSRILVVSLQATRICQEGGLLEAVSIENTMIKLATATVRILLQTDLADLRKLYDDLQSMYFRERGIRNEHYSAVCWVTLIQVLEAARIPRSSFWDVVSSAICGSDLSTATDVHSFERVWRNLFTVLPLGEFDNAGVIHIGARHRSPLEGWSLPQKLLRRIFQLYQSNTRQSASFNDYCRGIVSRCHYLVEQWGWRRCNTIIGTIFDFFAAQDLRNLRNEEVFQSPQFLENLAESPSLAVASEDRCFHIFLKLLALSIQRLRKFGLIKDVRNLVARVLPNHNRQHEKEETVHEIELAALRNHHDLLCTLFWAAPQDLRPSVQTIEKLVVPGSSHKEACLISLRAWGQLSRFIMSSSNNTADYQPFANWTRNIFQQMLDQYISVESDIQQQLLRMSKDSSRNISQEWKNAVIKTNKKAAMDVLHLSMKAFLDVLQYTTTLGTASFALNSYPLDQAFSRLSWATMDSDWSSLRASLDIIDYYLTRVESFQRNGPSCADHSWHGEDAIILLERKLATPYFSMLRGLMEVNTKGVIVNRVSEPAEVTKQAVSVGGRQAVRLIQARLSRVSHFFGTGKYHLFQDLSKPRPSSSRRYVPLFLATLIEGDVKEFKDLGVATWDILCGELVKPARFLAYENQLAAAIQRHGGLYLQEARIVAHSSPDYNSNRELFSRIAIVMRRALRPKDTTQKQQLQAQFSKTLRFTMDRIKTDLKSMPLDSAEHFNYIDFVRSIIMVIRSQDICPVDSYFYQISHEYSPSAQDPRLQTASILAWGLKLEENDTKAFSGLFYLLFPSFKLALANGQLKNERSILQQGMSQPHVLSFMFSKMFPAIIKVAIQASEGWVLLETYAGAFEDQLSANCIHRAIGRDDMAGLLALVKFVLAAVDHMQTLHVFELQPQHVVCLTLMLKILNLVSPSITAYIINDAASQTARDLIDAREGVVNFAREAGRYLSDVLRDNVSTTSEGQQIKVDPDLLFAGIRVPDADAVLDRDDYVNRFAKHMVQDIRQNWISNGGSMTMTVRGPSRPQAQAQGPAGTQSGQGTLVPRWTARELVRKLSEEIEAWNCANDVMTMRRVNAEVSVDLDEILF